MGATLNHYTVKLKIIGHMPPDETSRASLLLTALQRGNLPDIGTEFEVGWIDKSSKEASRKALKQFGTDRRLELEVISVTCKKKRI